MNRQENIESRVEAALNSLDGLQRAEANPFLITRLEARLQQQRNPGVLDRAVKWVAKPAFATAVVVALLVANYAMVSRQKANKIKALQEVENLVTAEFSATTNLYSMEAAGEK